MTAQSLSFIALLIPFGALLYDEPITVRALVGAALVVAGLLVTQTQGRRQVAAEPAPAAG
jgi:drug/metabolite transporter (DMT)-like permease